MCGDSRSLRASSTRPRAKAPNVKEQVVREKGFKNFVLQCEDIAEFDHKPNKCGKRR
jgi:hypothetical protein